MSIKGEEDATKRGLGNTKRKTWERTRERKLLQLKRDYIF